MNLKNWLTLTIRVRDFNLVAQQPLLLAKLRKLTIVPGSGLNYELDRMTKAAKERFVDCQIIMAYRLNNLVGWAILSREDTDFVFSWERDGFKGEEGCMFQVYVDPDYRRQGIASEIYKEAQKLAVDEVIHVSPWSDESEMFYDSFQNVNRKDL
jgi:ribosomal protein S18 acetylase RimI-like enzyme